MPSDDLASWIETLRARLALGELRDVEPFELPDGTVGPKSYIEVVNVQVGIYRRNGTLITQASLLENRIAGLQNELVPQPASTRPGAILQPAYLPGAPSSPSYKKNLALAVKVATEIG